jgi:hypothetical protein
MTSISKTRLPLQFAEGFQIQGSTPVQEDYFEINPDRGIFILADGFGGALGRQASELVVRSVRQYLEQEAGDLDATMPFELRPYYSLAGNVLFNAISFANQKLIEMNRGKTWQDSGGASLMGGYLEGRLLSVAQVGACRLVLKRGVNVKEVVTSRSLLRQVDPMMEEGPGDTVPLMSFGTAKSLEPEITEIELRPGDQVFFETSGVKREFRQKVLSLNGPSGLSHALDGLQTESNASMIWLGF